MVVFRRPAHGSIHSGRLSRPQVLGHLAARGRRIVGFWYAVGCGHHQLLDPLDCLTSLLSRRLWRSCCFLYGRGQILLGIGKWRGCSQDVIVSLVATGYVLLLKLTSEFLVFLCQHIVVVEQTITSLLAGLVRHRIVEVKMITRRMLGGMILVLPTII